MKIVVDARYISSTFSGIGVYSEQLLRHLSQIDEENEYTVLVHSSLDHKLGLGENFRLVRLDARPVSVGTVWNAVDNVLEEVEPQLFHSTFPLLPYQWDGPTIVTVHDLQPFTVKEFTGRRNPLVRFTYDMFYRWAYQRAFQKANVLMAVSQATKDMLWEHFPLAAHRTLVVNSGLDEIYFQPVKLEALTNVRAKFRVPERYILFVGSTRPNKNIPRMLLAFAEYITASGDADLQFVLVLKKDRFMADVEKAIASFGLQERIRILDQVTPEELRIIYSNAELLFFATKSEGFGFPVLEAQASGIPVIGSNDGAIPYVAGEGALLVEPDDSTELLVALETVLTDSNLRAQLVEAGAENCRRFTWSETARQVLEIYEYIFDPQHYEVSAARQAEAELTATRIGQE